MSPGSSPSGAASALSVTGPRPSRRPRRISIRASSSDQARPACAAGAAISGSSVASGQSAWNCGRRSAATQSIARGVQPSRARRAERRPSQSTPTSPRPQPRPRSGTRARPAASCSSSAFAARARLPRARARSPRDRAGRGRPLPRARASAGSSRPGSGAPPAARRRDRRTGGREHLERQRRGLR